MVKSALLLAVTSYIGLILCLKYDCQFTQFVEKNPWIFLVSAILLFIAFFANWFKHLDKSKSSSLYSYFRKAQFVIFLVVIGGVLCALLFIFL